MLWFWVTHSYGPDGRSGIVGGNAGRGVSQPTLGYRYRAPLFQWAVKRGCLKKDGEIDVCEHRSF